MKLSKREDYTFYLASELAKVYGKKRLSLTKIAKDSGISVYFLKQLVRPLLKKRLVESKEGLNGGYILSKKPNEITMEEIFLSINSLPVLTSCCSGKISCQREKLCKPGKIFRQLNKIFIKKLKKTKLSDLI